MVRRASINKKRGRMSRKHSRRQRLAKEEGVGNHYAPKTILFKKSLKKKK